MRGSNRRQAEGSKRRVRGVFRTVRKGRASLLCELWSTMLFSLGLVVLVLVRPWQQIPSRSRPQQVHALCAVWPGHRRDLATSSVYFNHCSELNSLTGISVAPSCSYSASQPLELRVDTAPGLAEAAPESDPTSTNSVRTSTVLVEPGLILLELAKTWPNPRQSGRNRPISV